MDKEKKELQLAEWKKQREILRPILAEFLHEFREVALEYEQVHLKLMKVKTQFDNLDRRIANVEKYKIIAPRKSGIKGKAKKTIDLSTLFKAMTKEEKKIFIESITKT